MNICPTGYCGHPCTCESSYDHTDKSDCKALIGILDRRLTKLAENEASKKHGVPFVEHATKKVVIKIMRCDHAIYKTDILLHEFVPNLKPDEINALSGLASVFKNEADEFTIANGYDPDALGWISYEIVNYKGEVAIQHSTSSTIYPDLTAYISLSDGKHYLPKETV